MYVAIAITIIVAAAILVGLLRLRIRFEVDRQTRLIFVGLGRSGLRLDFDKRTHSLQLMGITVKSSPMEETEDPVAALAAGETKPSVSESKTKPSPAKAKSARKKKTPRVRQVGEILRLVPDCSKALWGYSIGILKSLVVEQLEADIEAGFESPDHTGMAFGYYQAALAAAPGVVGKMRFTPDWTGASFDGAARGAVALPLYRLGWQTLRLLWRLPLRQILKVAIGTRKGGQDG
ncbi:MAG: hypothetical protein ABIE70_07810 [bacterium]